MTDPAEIAGSGREEQVESVDVADSSVPVEPEEQIADEAAAADEAPEAPEPDPVAEAQRERDEYLDHLRRERAEFENFRKRATKERMDALDRGAEQVVSSLLHVLDTFGFALAAAREEDADNQLAKGVEMVYAELVSVLKQSGLEDIEGVGSHFDPMHHEAMMQVEAHPPVQEPTVVEVLRPGYRFKGRVLRPASVKVAK
ncbi:MAG: nucleotide exchange factor GrpE [Nitriliruptorales bacterium]|nr:nucleotide exchange factor GrpE [Nitriliruptorales bacterium]